MPFLLDLRDGLVDQQLGRPWWSADHRLATADEDNLVGYRNSKKFPMGDGCIKYSGRYLFSSYSTSYIYFFFIFGWTFFTIRKMFPLESWMRKSDSKLQMRFRKSSLYFKTTIQCGVKSVLSGTEINPVFYFLLYYWSVVTTSRIRYLLWKLY